jgi:radical SAM superfamily enzyme YgiQ (UPF0313 family)
MLRDLVDWQRREGYPLALFTEASLDLADDAELLRLMVDANIVSVFIGIDSPNEASLRETRKYQNVRAGNTLVGRVHAIQRAGIEVWCGMILGFDNDGPGVFRAQREFLHEARIAHAMVGMLHAIPKTPLHARLAREGRLDPDDRPEFGTNVIPAGMSRQELLEGYLGVLQELYEPGAFFGRLEALFLREKFAWGPGRGRYWRRHPWQGLKARAAYLVRAAVLYARLMGAVPEARLRREYRRRLARLLQVRRDPAVVVLYLIKCAMHYHHYTLARQLAAGSCPLVNSF